MIERKVRDNPWVQAFGASIRLFRKKSGLNQTDFAVKIGMKQNSLSKMERGTYAPTLEHVYRIAKKLKVSPAVLFGRESGEPLPKSYEAFRKRFSRRLKAARVDRDLSQTELAEKAGTHQPTLSNIEQAVMVRGSDTKLTSPDLETIWNLAKALKIDGLSLFLD